MHFLKDKEAFCVFVSVCDVVYFTFSSFCLFCFLVNIISHAMWPLGIIR